MPHRKDGALLLVALAFATFSAGCPKEEIPPQFDLICTGDGYGGSDCVDGAGKRIHLLPTELKNFWMTNQQSAKRFMSWCYGTDEKVIESQMTSIEAKARGD